MSSVWARVKSLEGRTLYTLKQQKPFDVIKVLHDRILLVPRMEMARSDGSRAMRLSTLLDYGCPKPNWVQAGYVKSGQTIKTHPTSRL